MGEIALVLLGVKVFVKVGQLFVGDLDGSEVLLDLGLLLLDDSGLFGLLNSLFWHILFFVFLLGQLHFFLLLLGILNNPLNSFPKLIIGECFGLELLLILLFGDINIGEYLLPEIIILCILLEREHVEHLPVFFDPLLFLLALLNPKHAGEYLELLDNLLPGFLAHPLLRFLLPPHLNPNGMRQLIKHILIRIPFILNGHRHIIRVRKFPRMQISVATSQGVLGEIVDVDLVVLD